MDLLVDELTNKFAKTISDDDNEKDELVKAFKVYLKKSIDMANSSKYVNKSTEEIARFLNCKTEMFGAMDIIVKKQFLLRDTKLEEINRISKEIFDLASQKLSGKEINEKKNIEQEVETMKTLLNDVRPYNEKFAKKLISEAVLDLNFLDKPNTNVLSLRLYQLKSNMEKATEEREEI